MKKLSLLVIALALFNLNLSAQISVDLSTQKVVEKDFGITLNYFNEIGNHSGVEIGLESAILTDMFMAYKVGFYFTEDDKTDVSLYWEIGYRKTFKNGYSPDLRAGIGYLSTYISPNEEGQNDVFEIVYMPSVTIGALGYDFRKTKNIPLRLFGNALFYWKKPLEQSATNHFALQAGATYFFK